MSGARGEGAVIDTKARAVRLRHEPRGFLYQLRGDEAVVEVVRVDQLTGAEESYGHLQLTRGRWRAAKTPDKGKTDALLLVARAWNYVPLLKVASPSSYPAPASGTRIVDGADPGSPVSLLRGT